MIAEQEQHIFRLQRQIEALQQPLNQPLHPSSPEPEPQIDSEFHPGPEPPLPTPAAEPEPRSDLDWQAPAPPTPECPSHLGLQQSQETRPGSGTPVEPEPPTTSMGRPAPPSVTEPPKPPEATDSVPVFPAAGVPLVEGDREHIQQALKAHLGSSVWFCLRPRSQRDLCAAQSHYGQRQAQPMSQPPDFSEVGRRLGAAIAREVASPFFRALHSYVHAETGRDDIGGMRLGTDVRYTLDPLPALLSPQWQAWPLVVLHQSQPDPAQDGLVWVEGGASVSPEDRAQVQAFLATWEHPVAAWLGRSPAQAASTLAQIAQLHQRATSPDHPLYTWQVEQMRRLILGDETTRGVLREVFGTA